MRAQQVCMLASLLLGLAATVMAQQDFFIVLEDGSRLTYGDLRGMAGTSGCCFNVNFPFAVTYSSSNRIRFFIGGDKCDPAFEVSRHCSLRDCPLLIAGLRCQLTHCDLGSSSSNSSAVATPGSHVKHREHLKWTSEACFQAVRWMSSTTC